LEEAVAVHTGPCELVDAEPNLLVLARPVGAEAAVARRPRLPVVARLEEAEALDDRPEALRIVRVGVERRDPQVAGRLLRGVVPALALRLALERRQQCPRRAAITALEDPDLLGSDEHAPMRARERRDLRQLLAVLAVV